MVYEGSETKKSGITAFVTTKDEFIFIPSFLRYYRNLGVEQFNTEGSEHFFYNLTKGLKFNTRNFKSDFNRRNIQNARVIRNRFLKLYAYMSRGGNLKSKAIKAKNDKLNGDWFVYLENGKLLQKRIYKKGKLIKILKN